MRADLDAAFNADELNRTSELVLAFHGLAVMLLLDGLVDKSIVPLLRVASVRPRSEAALPRILRRLSAVSFASSLNVGSEEPGASLGRQRARCGLATRNGRCHGGARRWEREAIHDSGEP